MKPVFLLLPLLMAASPEAMKDSGEEATEAKAEAAAETGQVPESRITVVDSRDMPSDVEEESRVLKGAEMQEIPASSQGGEEGLTRPEGREERGDRGLKSGKEGGDVG